MSFTERRSGVAKYLMESSSYELLQCVFAAA